MDKLSPEPTSEMLSRQRAKIKRLSKAKDFKAISRSLVIGSVGFVVGIVVGFGSAVYDHEVKDLAIALCLCGGVFGIASCRLPIVYQIFVAEKSGAWKKDDSWGLLLAVLLCGLSFGLGLPAEFMLVELVVNDPSELALDRGGWVAVVILAIPISIGFVVCAGELREEKISRVKWARLRKKYGADPEGGQMHRTHEEIKILLDSVR